MLFDPGDLIDPPLMPFTMREFGFQEGIDDIVGQFVGNDPGAETDDVGVVVLSGEAGGSSFRAAAGSDALMLVAGNRDAHAGPADGDAQVNFFILDGFG